MSIQQVVAESPSASPQATPSGRVLTLDRALAAMSVGWLLVVLMVPSNTELAAWVTLGLLAVDAVVCVVVLFARKRVPVELNLAQLALFCVVHNQVYSVWGADHYTCDCPPTPLLWVQFTAAHALRAADVPDFIDEYAFDIQNIKHNKDKCWLSGTLLVAMHLTVDIFLLGLLWRGTKKLWSRIRRQRGTQAQQWDKASWLAQKLKIGKVVCLGVCVVAFVLTAAIQSWSGRDWALWPLDTIARLVDFFDAMNIYGAKWHSRPSDDWWLSTLAVSLRLFAGFYIAEVIVLLRLRVLKGAMRTIGELIEDLSHPNPAVRHGAAEVLGQNGPGAWEAVPALVTALADKDWSVRPAATVALERIDPNWAKNPSSQKAIPALITAFAYRHWESIFDPSPYLVPEVRADLKALCEASATLVVSGVHRAAAEALGKIGPAAVSALISALLDKDWNVRKYSAKALGLIGPAAAPAVSALITALTDVEKKVRQAAATALGKIGPTAEIAIPALINALADERPGVRRAVATALGKIGPTAEIAIPALISSLADLKDQVREATAEALGLIGPTAIPALSIALADEHSSLRQLSRQSAANALGRIGPAAAPTIPALLTALAEKDGYVSVAAARALCHIDPSWTKSHSAQETIPALITALDKKNWGDRQTAAEALGLIGPAAESAIPALRAAQADSESMVRTAVSHALELIEGSKAS